MLAILTACLLVQAPWPPKTLSEVKLNPVKVEGLVREIRKGGFGKIHSLIVVKDGGLVCEEYFNGTTADTPQDLQSATKSIASIVVGIAIDKGCFRLTDRVLDLLPPGYPHPEDRAATTVKDVLTMKHGMRWREWGATPQEKDNYIMANGRDWIGYLLKQPMADPPGRTFSYSTGASVYLSGILHGKSGMTTEQFSRKYLFDPLGIKSQSWWIKDAKGIEHTGGGLKMTAMDLARIGYLVLKDGKWSGRQIVSKRYLDAAFTPDTENALAVGDLKASYGYHCWLLSAKVGDKTYRVRTAMGVGGQYVFVIQELGLVVVTTAWNTKEPEQSRPLGWIKQIFLPNAD